MSLGIPIKVLHEAEGHVVTCESSTGEVYRGKLVEAEEHMNLQVNSKKKNKQMRPKNLKFSKKIQISKKIVKWIPLEALIGVKIYSDIQGGFRTGNVCGYKTNHSKLQREWLL